MYKIHTKKTARSRKYEKVIAQFEIEKEVIAYIANNNITPQPNPYLFTHISLSDGSIIKLEVGGFVVSPVSLANKLGL